MADPKLDKDKLVREKNDRYDFDRLLEPYREGGNPEQPIRRTVGTLLDWLQNKKKFPVDVAGAAFLIVMEELADGRKFPGDGTYGSAGHQMAVYMASVANQLNQRRMQAETFKTMMGARDAIVQELVFYTCRKMFPWWLRIFAPNTWVWLRKRRVKKAKIKKMLENESS